MNETIFRPFSSDSVEAHSWTTLEGRRFCLGDQPGCPHCQLRLFQEYQALWWKLIGAKRHAHRREARQRRKEKHETKP